MGPVTATAVLLLVATLTPGPNNLLMLHTRLERGLRAALRLATGVVLGGLVMLLGAYAGVAALVAAHPGVRPLITGGGAVFVAWLGLRLICNSLAPAAARTRAASPGGVLGMALFQLTNPKSWLLVLTASATASAHSASAAPLAALLLLFMVIPYASLALWAGGGSLAARLLHEPRARARFEFVNGILLAASALLVLWQR